MSYLNLFWVFIQVGLFSIGGGYAAVPIIQSLVVDRYGWITLDEFTDLVTIAEMTPGPIVVNAATFTGSKVLGFPGALVATFGSILPSCFIVSILFSVYYRFRKNNGMQRVLSCLRPAVTALIASAGLSILINAVGIGREDNPFSIGVNIINAGLFVIAFLLIRKWKKNPVVVMLCCGAAYLIAGIIIGRCGF